MHHLRPDLGLQTGNQQRGLLQQSHYWTLTQSINLIGLNGDQRHCRGLL